MHTQTTTDTHLCGAGHVTHDNQSQQMGKMMSEVGRMWRMGCCTVVTMATVLRVIHRNLTKYQAANIRLFLSHSKNICWDFLTELLT